MYAYLDRQRRTAGTSAGEEPDDLPEAGGEGVDVLGRREDREARPGRRRDVEPLVERHRAVVAGPDADPEAVEDLGDVVGVDPRQVEGDDPAPLLGRRTVEDDLGELPPERLEGVGDEALLVLTNPLHV